METKNLYKKYRVAIRMRNKLLGGKPKIEKLITRTSGEHILMRGLSARNA